MKKKTLPLSHDMRPSDIKKISGMLRKGPLSGFLGAPGEEFFGGKEVRALERAVARKFKVKHAVSFNSGTTALHGAMVALCVGPGDEVIVPPYTMSATAMAPLMNGAVPIFADIDEKTFCIDPKSVRERITKHTKAIIAVNLFGQAADLTELRRIARAHKLFLVEDNAQSIGAKHRGKLAGTIGDIGVLSFNIHKLIQSGEGGMLLTNNDRFARRAQMCRNHGENAASVYKAGPLIGSNYRMTEVSALIARLQFERHGSLLRKRLSLVKRLEKRLSNIEGLELPCVAPGNTHTYFVYALKVDEKKLGISRDELVGKMEKEGFPMSRGYVEPLYLLPVFQSKRAFNATPFPFRSEWYKGSPDYSRGICPVVERMHDKEFTFTLNTAHRYTNKDVDRFAHALKRIIRHKKK